MPKGPGNERANDRQERFARIHRLLRNFSHTYPGPKSFMLWICNEMTELLQTEPDSLALPFTLGEELPNLASDLVRPT